MKEFIICAANYYNDGQKHLQQPKNIEIGFVIFGRRHLNACYLISLIKNSHTFHKTEKKGFITNTNRFVDRKEAYKIAFEADQIIGPNKGCPTNEIGLTSEDLY